MTNHQNVRIENYGYCTISAEAMDLTMMRYLPASPSELHERCMDAGISVEWIDSLLTATEYLWMLCDAVVLPQMTERNASNLICLRVDRADESFETTLEQFLRDNEGEFAEDEIIEVSNLPVGESISFGGGAAVTSTITRI